MYLIRAKHNYNTDIYFLTAESRQAALDKFTNAMTKRFDSFEDVEVVELTCSDNEIKVLDSYGDLDFYSIEV